MLIRLLKKPVVSLFLLAALCAAKPIYMLAKAQLAQYLLQQSWQQNLANNESDNLPKKLIKPWPWLDGYAVAKLAYWPAQMAKGYQVFSAQTPQETAIVLAGMTMRNMAFAPSWWQSSAPPNQQGNTVIAAHNDSHFAFLEQVKIGDIFSLTDNTKQTLFYQVSNTEVINKNQIEVMQYQEEMQLTLITCYPFDGSVDKELRLVVTAEAITIDTP